MAQEYQVKPEIDGEIVRFVVTEGRQKNRTACVWKLNEPVPHARGMEPSAPTVQEVLNDPARRFGFQAPYGLYYEEVN